MTPDAIQGIVDRWIETEIDWSTLPAFSIIGMDEIALKKGHRDFIAIVTARLPNGTLHLLAVLPDRTKETVRTWLQSIPAPTRGQIRTVCTDMWEAYVAAVREILPVKGFHLTNGWLPDAAKRRAMACQGVVQHVGRPYANALQAVSRRVGAFTIQGAAFLMRSTTARGRAKV